MTPASSCGAQRRHHSAGRVTPGGDINGLRVSVGVPAQVRRESDAAASQNSYQNVIRTPLGRYYIIFNWQRADDRSCPELGYDRIFAACQGGGGSLCNCTLSARTAQSFLICFVPPGHHYSPIVNPLEANRHLAALEGVPTPKSVSSIMIDRAEMSPSLAQPVTVPHHNPFP